MLDRKASLRDEQLSIERRKRLLEEADASNDLHYSFLDKLIIHYKKIFYSSLPLSVLGLVVLGTFALATLGVAIFILPMIAVAAAAVATGITVILGLSALAAWLIPPAHQRVTEAMIREAVHEGDINSLNNWLKVACKEGEEQSLAWDYQFKDGSTLIDYIIKVQKESMNKHEKTPKVSKWFKLRYDNHHLHHAQTLTLWLDAAYQRYMNKNAGAEVHLISTEKSELSLIQRLYRWYATRQNIRHRVQVVYPHVLSEKLNGAYTQAKYVYKGLLNSHSGRLLRELTPNEIASLRWTGKQPAEIAQPKEDKEAVVDLPQKFRRLAAAPSLNIELNKQVQVERQQMRDTALTQQMEAVVDLANTIDESRCVTVNSLYEKYFSQYHSCIDFNAACKWERPGDSGVMTCRRWGDYGNNNLKKWMQNIENETSKKYPDSALSISKDALSCLSEYGGNIKIYTNILNNLPLGFYLVEDGNYIALRFSEEKRQEQRADHNNTNEDIIALGRANAIFVSISWMDTASNYQSPQELINGVIKDLGVVDGLEPRVTNRSAGEDGSYSTHNPFGLLERRHVNALNNLAETDKYRIFNQYKKTGGQCYFDIGLDGNLTTQKTTPVLNSIEDLKRYYATVGKTLTQQNMKFLSKLKVMSRSFMILAIVQSFAEAQSEKAINKFISCLEEVESKSVDTYSEILDVLSEEVNEGDPTIRNKHARSLVWEIKDIGRINDLLMLLSTADEPVHQLYRFLSEVKSGHFSLGQKANRLSIQDLADVFPVVLNLAQKRTSGVEGVIAEFEQYMKERNEKVSGASRKRYVQFRQFIAPEKNEVITDTQSQKVAQQSKNANANANANSNPNANARAVRKPSPYDINDLTQLIAKLGLDAEKSSLLHQAIDLLNQKQNDYLNKFKTFNDFKNTMAESKTWMEGDASIEQKMQFLAVIRHGIFLLSGGNKWLRLEQVVAILLNFEYRLGNNIDTSEGKTTIIQVVALMHAAAGRKMNIYTHAESYAVEDFDAYFVLLTKSLGITASSRYKINGENDDIVNDDIFYIDIAQAVMEAKDADIKGIKRRHADVALVDEADNPLFDVDSTTSLRVPGEGNNTNKAALKLFLLALNAAVEKAIQADTEQLQNDVDQAMSDDDFYATLSAREQAQWVQSALTAMSLKERENYIVNFDGKVSKVDIMHPETTGREDTRSCWSNGVHQLVAARESLRHKNMFIPPLSTVIADSNTIQYLRSEYGKNGMPLDINLFSGTLGSGGLLTYLQERTGIENILMMPSAKRALPPISGEYDAQAFYDVYILPVGITFDMLDRSSIKDAVVVAPQSDLAKEKNKDIVKLTKDSRIRIIRDGEWCQLDAGKKVFESDLQINSDISIHNERLTLTGKIKWQDQKTGNEDLNTIITQAISQHSANANEMVVRNWPKVMLEESKVFAEDRYNRRYDFTSLFSDNKVSHFAKGLEAIRITQRNNYSIIVFFATVKQCEAFYSYLRENDISNVQVFDDTKAVDNTIIKRNEDDMKGMASVPGYVTITTAAAGRATDFSDIDIALDMVPSNDRVHNQGIGRVGRNGQLAATYTLINIEDLGVDLKELVAQMQIAPGEIISAQSIYSFWQKQKADETLKKLQAKTNINEFKADITAEYIDVCSQHPSDKDTLQNKWAEFYGSIDSLWDYHKPSDQEQVDVLKKWRQCFNNTVWSSLRCGLGDSLFSTHKALK